MNSNSDNTTAIELKGSQSNNTFVQQRCNSYTATPPTTLGGDLYHAGSGPTLVAATTIIGGGSGGVGSVSNINTFATNNKLTATVDGSSGGNNITTAANNINMAINQNSSSTNSSIHDYDNRQSSINNGIIAMSSSVGGVSGGVGVVGGAGGFSKPQERYVWEMRARSPNVTPASTVLNSPDLNTDLQYSIHPHQRQLQQIRVGRSPGSQFEQHNILPQVGGIGSLG